MDIRLHSLLEGARSATGVVGVIDVFRAFTTAAVAFSRGAASIIMVSGVEDALSLRQQGAGQICMGEVDGRPPPEFDFGNSPYELLTADVAGKTLIQRTSAGTLGMTAAHRAEQRYACALVTAGATVRAMRAHDPAIVTLVAMGKNARERTDEDELCASHLRNLLEGRPGDIPALQALIRAGGEVPRFYDPARPWLHREDVDIALDVDRFDFAIEVVEKNGRPVAFRA